MKNTLVYASLVSLALVGVFMLVIFYWMFWPYKTYEPDTEKIILVKNVLHACDTLQWYSRGFHHTNGVSVDVSRQLWNDTIINFPPTSYVTTYGRLDTKNTLKIPCYAPVGKYKLKVWATFHVNPIRDVLFTRESEEFVIVE